MRIAIVGPCAAGKSTLEANLIKLGYDARAVAQEHSGVQTMWLEITKPDILIYLDVSLAEMNQRLKVSWEQAYLDEMKRRLTRAREHADFFLATNDLTVEQVRDQAVDFLKARGNRKTAR